MTEITVSIPAPLRAFINGNKTVLVSGVTVEEALKNLVNYYPGLKKHLYKNDQIRNFVNIYKGDTDIRYLDNEQTSLNKGDQLLIVPSIAGGTI